jgi:hypothetical protein
MEKKDNKKKTTKASKSASVKIVAPKKDVKKVVASKDEIKVPEEEIIIKKITEKKERKIKINRRDIIVAVVFLIIGALLGIFLFKRAPKLKNGEQVAVSVDKYKVTEQDIYNDIRENNGLNSALRMIDLAIVKKYYNGAKDEDAKSNSEEQADTYIKQYVNMGYTEEQFLKYYGFATKEEFIKYLECDYLLNLYFEDKVKEGITDDDVNEYYDKYGIGKKVVYIFSEKDSTDNLDKVRAALKKGTAVDKVASKYEKTVVINSKVEVDYKSISSYSDAVASYIKKTNASSYSKVFNDDTLGNVFVYVDTAEDTPAKDDIKSEIVSALVDKKKTEDSELYFKTFIEERKKSNIKFYDDEYSKQYDEYVKSHTKGNQDNK